MVALGIAAAAAACSSDGGSSSPATGAKPDGKAIFAANCATCHAADGSGGQGPAIGDGAANEALSEADMVEVVTDGKAAMPAWKGTLSKDEIAAVVDYVRTDLGRTDGRTDTDRTTTTQGTTKRGSLRGVPPELDVDGDWAIANGDYASTRAVLDSPITSKTVDDLELDWSYEATGGGTFGNLTTTPLVVGDHVYVGDLTTRVHAIDRKTGKGEFVVGDEVGIFGPTGVGVGWGQLYGTRANDDGKGSVVVAYDAATGKVAWATDVGE
jgi:mono/diheme cytochrome c family protein